MHKYINDNINDINKLLFGLVKAFTFLSIIYLFRNYDILNKILRTKAFYEMIKVEYYFKICNERNLKNKKIFKKRNKPKISLITPVYNKETTILRYLRSVQNQLFHDIEIIIVDDKSSDNSLTIVEKAQKEDDRIILIKNAERKGTLISKNIGVCKSIGEYLLFVDPDDILSRDILNYLYKLIIKNEYDLIRFNIYTGEGGLNLPEISYHLKRNIIKKPNIFYYLFYGFGKLYQLDFYLTNKLIKRNLFINALNSINKYYLRQFMIDCEDGLVNFMLYKLSQTLLFTKKIGYYYILTNKSITHNSTDFKQRLRSNFLYLKYLIEYTKNNNIEKKMAVFVFSDIFSHHLDTIVNLFEKLRYDYRFYLNVINKYAICKFIPLNIRKTMTKLKKIIKKNKQTI